MKIDKVFSRLKNFRAPQKLQYETLQFLVNNVNRDFDFVGLRNAFRELDASHSGYLNMNEMEEAFKGFASKDELDQIFEKMDFNHHGEVNYT